MRRGLVLGGGSLLGAAWTVGALTALEEVRGISSDDFEIKLGTSAGSILAALLALGVSTNDLLRHQHGEVITEGPLAGYDWDYDLAAAEVMNGRPTFRGANPKYLVRNRKLLKKMPPSAVWAALVPQGTVSLKPIYDLVSTAELGKSWPQGLWVNAFNYDFGYRTIFGQQEAPNTTVADAVCASCAIPGWFSPVVINGNRYVDGGTWSPTSVDVLLDQDLDEVVVLAPMAAYQLDRPSDVATSMERAWRLRVTKRVLSEVGKLRRKGIRVTMITPTPEDLMVLGSNTMDVNRRSQVLELSLETTRRSLTTHF